MELTGIVIAAMPTQKGVSQKTGNPWMSRDFVLEVQGPFPSHMVFRVFGEDRLRQFDIRKNDEVTVKFDIDAREYQGRWWNTITAYDVVKVSQQQVAPPPQQASAPPMTAPQPTQEDTQAGDDLPF